MKPILSSLLLLLLVAAPAMAQTATPTPLSAYAREGFYAHTAIVAPIFSVSAGWVIATYANQPALNTSAANATITFWVSEATDVIVWYHRRFQGSTAQVCTGWSTCVSINTELGYSSISPLGLRVAATPLYPVTIRRTGGTNLDIIAIQIMNGAYPTPTPIYFSSPTPSSPSATPTITPTATVTPTPTPPPWVDATLAPSGQLTRFEYVATASDVHLANLLTLILISSWGMFLLWFFIGRNRK